MTDSIIKIPVLARIEGEGALDIHCKDGKLEHLDLRIYEPPRFFENFLVGRTFQEVPDIVARICGICPVAYQMSAIHAIEQIADFKPTPWIRDMRRLFYCGEWLESHALHIHLLALPDFLGYRSAIEMAQNHADAVRRGLQLQALGNRIITLLGGRSVHPIGARVGGFAKAPDKSAITNLLSEIENNIEQATELLKFLTSLSLPDEENAELLVALQHPDEYAMNEGEIAISDNKLITLDQFADYFKEKHVPHSTALHCLYQDKPYLTGPLARLGLNYEKLPGEILRIVEQASIRMPSKNIFHSILARGVEILYALFEAKRVCEQYSTPEKSYYGIGDVSGEGYGCTEAPRGILWHHYKIDQGIINYSRIVPPTSQNQAQIEADLTTYLNALDTIDESDPQLLKNCEMRIRNYDPCISCATHFLKLNVQNL